MSEIDFVNEPATRLCAEAKYTGNAVISVGKQMFSGGRNKKGGDFKLHLRTTSLHTKVTCKRILITLFNEHIKEN